MKHVKKILFAALIVVLSTKTVYAAGSASISVSRSSIEQGDSVSATVTVNNTAAWNIKMSGSGATSGCSANYADATANGGNTTKSFTVTCKSTKTGTINFSFSGDVTSSDGANVNVSGSKTVTVNQPRQKSNNNNLKSLGLEGYTITPEFNKDTLEYRVELPAEVEKITVSAAKEDGYASINGTGEKEVTEGENRIEVVVTSETGKAKTYIIIATVKDNHPIEVTVDGKKYTVVKKSSLLTKPDLFEEKKITINDIEVPAFYNDVTKLTLIGLKDEQGQVSLYIYNEKSKEYTKYQTINLIILKEAKEVSVEYKKTTFKIGDNSFNGYQTSPNKEFILVYGIHLETGIENWYVYQTKEKSIQLYDEQLVNSINQKYQDQIKQSKIAILGLGGLSVFLLIILIILVCCKKKKHHSKKEIEE